ncbi:MAG TPA: VOC family protein [Ktedonobacteraceae bacterium]|jgi:catechol 2,3-dioxygenase-like lactoylglutathione lyase family enzyme
MGSIYQSQGLRLPRLHHASLPMPGGGQEQIRAFYGKLVGLQEKTPPTDIAKRGVLWFVAGDNEMEIHFLPDEFLANAQEGRHICFEVDNVEEYRQRIAAAGHAIEEGSPIAHRPRFFCRDPFNNLVEFTTIEGDYLSAQ